MVQNNYIFGKKYGKALIENLVAYYAFENNANDSHGGKNGTLVAGGYTTGKNGSAFEITAQNHVITVPDNDDFTFADGSSDLPFSFSCWLYTTSYSANGNRFFSKREASLVFEYLFLVNASIFSFVLYSDNSGSLIKRFQCSNPTSLNTWFMLTFTYDGLSGKIYINGNLQTTTTTITGSYSKMLNTNAILRIGSNNTTLASTAQLGRMDELAIWKNRELNATEVAELYNAGIGKFYPF